MVGSCIFAVFVVLTGNAFGYVFSGRVTDESNVMIVSVDMQMVE